MCRKSYRMSQYHNQSLCFLWTCACLYNGSERPSSLFLSLSLPISPSLCRSLFVLLKGASKDEAFRIGREITERVTADNPKPVKLKFEKASKMAEGGGGGGGGGHLNIVWQGTGHCK